MTVLQLLPAIKDGIEENNSYFYVIAFTTNTQVNLNTNFCEIEKQIFSTYAEHSTLLKQNNIN